MEKKTELKVAAGGLTAIIAMVLPIVVAVAKSLAESGIFEAGSSWYAILAAVAAAGAAAAGTAGVAKISGDYSASRAAVKASRIAANAAVLNPTPPSPAKK